MPRVGRVRRGGQAIQARGEFPGQGPGRQLRGEAERQVHDVHATRTGEEDSPWLEPIRAGEEWLTSQQHVEAEYVDFSDTLHYNGSDRLDVAFYSDVAFFFLF